MNQPWRSLLFVVSFVGWSAVAKCYAADAPAELPPSAAKQIDFAADVEPIFARACYRCHGAEKQRSGYRLDVKSVALKGGELGQAIIPGRSAESTPTGTEIMSASPSAITASCSVGAMRIAISVLMG